MQINSVCYYVKNVNSHLLFSLKIERKELVANIDLKQLSINSNCHMIGSGVFNNSPSVCLKSFFVIILHKAFFFKCKGIILQWNAVHIHFFNVFVLSLQHALTYWFDV